MVTDKRKRLEYLVHQVIEIRTKDFDLQKKYCEEILTLAEKEDYYEIAFAHVYLFDWCTLAGDFTLAEHHLIKAKELCEFYKYKQLLQLLYITAGLYYQNLNADLEAIDYFLQTLKVCETDGDYTLKSKVWNNIAISFFNRDDKQTAKIYFKKAFDIIEPHLDEGNQGNEISYLANFAEACQYLNDWSSAEYAIRKCERSNIPDKYWYFRLCTVKFSQYAIRKDKDGAIAILKDMLEAGIEEYPNLFFKRDAYSTIINYLLYIDAKELTAHFMQLLENCSTSKNITYLLKLQEYKVRFHKQYGDKSTYCDAYEKYYDLSEILQQNENKQKSFSIVSRIQLSSALLENTQLIKETEVLKKAYNYDKLTDLYNRKYQITLYKNAMKNKAIQKIACIMLDVDYFKEYNDTYGHSEGDAVLRNVAAILKANGDKRISAIRYGGDEFLCICLNMRDDEILQYIISIITELNLLAIPHKNSKCADQVTLSIGYCCKDKTEDMKLEDLISYSDRALYKAKDTGRNHYIKDTE